MGWVESPSLFCAVTESARDITQHLVDNNVKLPFHPIEDKMTIQRVPLRARTPEPTELLQVYVDDFCHAATQSTDGSHISKIRRAAIHGIHSVFPPTSVTKHIGGKEPISDRKLENGDGNFETEKEMIGFEFDGIKRTIRLPAAKARRYIKEAHTMLRRKWVPIKLFQTVIGKLRHATTILPAAEGLFSPVNSILRSPAKSLQLGKDIKSAILDLCSLIHLLGARPTHVRELIPDTPQYIGYHDAAAEGSGGVWFSLEFAMRPLLWREEFPHDIASNVVSQNNPTGGITNSDLELAAELFAVGIILANAPQIKHATLGTLCDNSPTVSWINRMASKSKSAVAGSLLRGLSFMLYTHHAGRLTTVHVKGEENVMADIASRPTKARALFGSATHSLSDDKFSSSFDLAFPLPNKQVWHLVGVPTWLRSNVFDTLRGKRLDLRLWAEPNGTSIGRRGRYTAASTKSAPKAPPPPTPKPCSSPLLSPCGMASTAKDARLKFSQSRKLSEPSPKNTFWTDTPTSGSPPLPNTTSTSLSPDS
jgi:hypothetical protein